MPLKGDEPSEKITRLIGRLDEKIRVEATCSTCGGDGWTWGENTLFLRQPGADESPTPLGLEVFPLVCANCGFMRFYSVEELGAESSDEDY